MKQSRKRQSGGGVRCRLNIKEDDEGPYADDDIRANTRRRGRLTMQKSGRRSFQAEGPRQECLCVWSEQGTATCCMVGGGGSQGETGEETSYGLSQSRSSQKQTPTWA